MLPRLSFLLPLYGIMSCYHYFFASLQILLEFGAQSDIQGSWGQSPLMICIITEYLDIAELLLENSTVNIIDAKDTGGNSPLHMAVEHDSVESVQLLLKFGADVNITNNHGITPLMAVCAIKTAENAAAIVRLLLDNGAACDERDFRSRRTALHVCTSKQTGHKCIH